jgi:hypothetical protein
MAVRLIHYTVMLRKFSAKNDIERHIQGEIRLYTSSKRNLESRIIVHNHMRSELYTIL